MLTYPSINPVAFSLGPLHVHWYGLMYLLGMLLAWLLGHWRNRHYHLGWSSEQITDLIFYSALGLIIGGRVGYMFFYQWPQFIQEPLALLRIWEGGMSFHGGLIGGVIGLCFFAHKTKKPLRAITDFAAPLVPLGLGAGRIGNFINGELWGSPTEMPWGMVFPHVDELPRHASQLYEFGLEGIALFLVVWFYASKPRPLGRVTAVFLIGYAICRMIAELFRQPDAQLGYLAFDWLTMGQLLSIPMIVVGLCLWWAKR